MNTLSNHLTFWWFEKKSNFTDLLYMKQPRSFVSGTNVLYFPPFTKLYRKTFALKKKNNNNFISIYSDSGSVQIFRNE